MLQSASKFRASLLAVAAVICVPGPLFAQESGQWSYSVTPYGWLAGFEGDVATLSGVPETNVDLSFGDVLDNLDFAFMAAAEARKGRYGLFFDLVYADIEPSSTFGPRGFSSVSVNSETILATFMAEYRLKTGSSGYCANVDARWRSAVDCAGKRDLRRPSRWPEGSHVGFRRDVDRLHWADWRFWRRVRFAIRPDSYDWI